MLRRLWHVPLTALFLSACGDAPEDSGDDGGASDETGADTDQPPAGTTDQDDPTTAGPGSQSDSATESTGDPDETSTTAPDDTTAGPTSDPTEDPTSDPTEDPTTDPTGDPPEGVDCLFEPFVNEGALVIDYEQFDPIIGSHCKGTNHQDIIDIERVVFLGDSVTVGTPPTQRQGLLPLAARRHAGRQASA
jgi:hypothetical protein